MTVPLDQPSGRVNADAAAQLVNQLTDGMVDIHTHAIDPDMRDVGERYPGSFPSVRRTAPDRAQILLDGRVYREIDERCWSVEARLRDMDAERVAIQVLSPIPVTLGYDEPAPGAAVFARAQNDFLASMTAQAPRRFLALGCLALQEPETAILEMTRCVSELGFIGVEIGTTVGDKELTDPTLLPFFEAAAALGAVVFVHPVDRTLDPRLRRLGVEFGMGMPTETAHAAAGVLLSDLFDRVPELLLCLAHAGGTLPWALPRIAVGQELTGRLADQDRLVTRRAGHLWCDSLTYDVSDLMLAAKRFGRQHVVLGTDYPFAARETPAGAVLDASELGDVSDLERSNIGECLALAARHRASLEVRKIKV